MLGLRIPPPPGAALSSVEIAMPDAALRVARCKLGQSPNILSLCTEEGIWAGAVCHGRFREPSPSRPFPASKSPQPMSRYSQAQGPIRPKHPAPIQLGQQLHPAVGKAAVEASLPWGCTSTGELARTGPSVSCLQMEGSSNPRRTLQGLFLWRSCRILNRFADQVLEAVRMSCSRDWRRHHV